MTTVEPPTEPVVEPLPETPISVVRTPNNDIVFIDHTAATQTVALAASEAVKLHKLLIMPENPIPEYAGKHQFIICKNSPQESREALVPVVEAVNDDIQLTGRGGDSVLLPPVAQRALVSCLDDWQYQLGVGDHPTILSLPSMITMEGEGLVEPLLHDDHDEVLEHFFQPVGYWSPSEGRYVTMD